MRKFVLSKYASIEIIYDFNKEKTYILKNIFRKETFFVINEIIFNFLKYFEQPCSFDSILDNIYLSIKDDNKSTKEDVKSILHPFFDDLKKRGLLVLENNIEASINFKPLYKKGDSINDFKVIDIVNETKYFDIYLVERNNEKYVIKYLNHKKFIKQSKYLEYVNLIKCEYNYLKLFNSDSICKVYQLNDNNKDIFVLMKYYDSTPINIYFLENKMDLDIKLTILKSIINAFAIIHSRGIYHGDIHFGNVLIDNDKRIVIIDFGMAGFIKSNSEINKYQQQFNQKVGGVHVFIPPERIIYNKTKSKKYYDIETLNSEVYQIGVLCYFILFDKLPFKSETINKLYEEKSKYNPRKDIIISNSDLEKKIKNLLIKSLENKKNDRFDNANSMLTHLNI